MIPAGPPSKLPVIASPSLCEAGPCRNFHRIRSVMDAEDGGTPGADRLQVSRACYPTAGIEIELGETPILQCSRWEPDSEQSRLDSIRLNFLKSKDGVAFKDAVAAYEASQDAHDTGPAARAEAEAAFPAVPAAAVLAAMAPIATAAVEEKSDLSNGMSDADLDALEDEGNVDL